MHALTSIRATVILLQLCVSNIGARNLQQIDIPRKCCDNGFAFNDNYDCVKQQRINESDHEWSGPYVTVDISFTCSDHIIPTSRNCDETSGTYSTIFIPTDSCIDMMVNGTEVLVKCSYQMSHDSDSTIVGGIGAVIFWGAQTYMPANIAHAVLCLIVVIVYYFVPDLGNNLHNRAVLRHNISLLILGVILTLLGYCEICECMFGNTVTSVLWLCLQFISNASVYWLNVICFDMTIMITRFHWLRGDVNRNEREDNRRLLLYDILVWGGSLLPTMLAAVLEFYPQIPNDFPLKANYNDSTKGPKTAVNMYFFLVPMCTLFCNNILFVFTTYRIIKIQRSTEMATKKHTNFLKKKYFLFLRLYLLMGAPWFFGTLLACFNKLFLLKVTRMIQPTLWLIMLVTHKKFRQKISSKLSCARSEDSKTPTTMNS